MANPDNTIQRQRLVVRIGNGTLAFSTINENGRAVYEVYEVNNSISMAANLREALRTEPLLQQRYRRVLVMIDTTVLMVPIDLFSKEQCEELYYHTFTRQDQHCVLYNVMSDLSCVAVFSMHRDLRTVIQDAFDPDEDQSCEISYAAARSTVWQHLHQRSYTGPRLKLYCYFLDNRLEIFSFTQNRFKFYNNFTANNPDDALYYILATWKQLGMDATHDELHMVGKLPDGEALKAKVPEFVKRVYVINPSGEFNRAPVTQLAGIPYDMVTLYMKGR